MAPQVFPYRVWPIRRPLLLVVLLLVSAGFLWKVWGDPLPKGLPPDLLKKQLVELALPPSIERLDWLPGGIEVLDAAGTKITSLKGVPPSVRRLDVSYTEIRSLKHIPQKLESLDIRGTRIEHLVGLPSRLKTLKVSGRKISRLGKLPASLVDLHLQNTGISDLSELPPNLTTLYLEGQSFRNLDGLPESLTSLTLYATTIKELKNLPASLQRLDLRAAGNLKLRREDLPPLLTELVTDSPSYLPLDANQPLPYLFSVKFNVPDFSNFPALPSSVRILGLLNADRGIPLEDLLPNGDYPRLPDELMFLDLTGYQGPEIRSLQKVASLRTLDLAYSSFSQLPELPPGLEELNLNGTKITNLKLLPKNLKALIFCDSPLETVAGDTDLPPSLKRLNLCRSRSLRLLSIPGQVQDLDLGGCHNLTKLPKLGPELKTLDISNTGIDSLPELPTVEVLIVDEGQSARLVHLPKKIKALRIVKRDKI